MSTTDIITAANEKVSDADARKIHAIAKRAGQAFGFEPLLIDMDLTVVHADIGLRLDELLAADSLNFAHDIGGIRNHLNRETGELENFFLPRYAVPQSSKEVA